MPAYPVNRLVQILVQTEALLVRNVRMSTESLFGVTATLLDRFHDVQYAFVQEECEV